MQRLGSAFLPCSSQLPAPLDPQWASESPVTAGMEERKARAGAQLSYTGTDMAGLLNFYNTSKLTESHCPAPSLRTAPLPPTPDLAIKG